ncbi:MAG: hypothetical protein KME27_10925 [Lyngbya sp. HA4199-MV5]|jgi:hypothetical protein|nr:hypothetical protein [Lyngbya sp. HA4199-MV5]
MDKLTKGNAIAGLTVIKHSKSGNPLYDQTGVLQPIPDGCESICPDQPDRVVYRCPGRSGYWVSILFERRAKPEHVYLQDLEIAPSNEKRSQPPESAQAVTSNL